MISISVCGLLYSAWCVVFGISGLISATRSAARSRSIGQIAQGVVLTFAVGGAAYRDSVPIAVGGAVVLLMLLLHVFFVPMTGAENLVVNKDESA